MPPLPPPPLQTPTSFSFPYPTPYSIQLDLMRTVFSSIEDRKIALISSPTGTGKSLTLLTGGLSWLREDRGRVERAGVEGLRKRLEEEGGDDPQWVTEHAINRHISELQAASDELKERMAKARQAEQEAIRRSKLKGGFGHASKRARLTGPEEEVLGGDEDAQFLPFEAKGEEEGDNISPEVRALMARLAEGTKARDYGTEEDEEPETPKIFYASRTHTQLRQLTSELLKTVFANPAPAAEVIIHTHGKRKDPTSLVAPDPSREAEMPVRAVPLGGRKQLCINKKVREVGERAGDDRMNEACLDLQKADSKGRCEFLPTKEQDGKMVEFRDQILATVRDIEDIVELGKVNCVCPYYATRRSVKQAELVTLPYNLLLQKNAREASGVNLKDQIVIIDEAHNLIDTLLSIHSLTLPLTHLITARHQLQTYLDRFKTCLRSEHALQIKQLISFLRELIKVCQGWIQEPAGPSQPKRTSPKDKLIRVNDLVGMLGGGGDINLIHLVGYLKESQLARKVSSYTENVAVKRAKAEGKSTPNNLSSISAFRQVESFLLSLTDANEDGRILISFPTENGVTTVKMKYLLLNPAEHFKQVVEDARCVILAGGTMEPVSDFLIQLFPSIPRDRFATLSCAHVIPKNNLLAQVITHGPGKGEMEFTYEKRGDKGLLLELGSLVNSLINLIPDGVVIFLPSYTFLDKLKEVWGSSGVLAKLELKKKVFYEPQTATGVDEVLQAYSDTINQARAADMKGKRTGALMLAVVGAKLSEGINFSDHLGRAVIMVGLPFANSGSTELRERMKYVDTLAGAPQNAGRELYENLCMRAVNQSIGRAIRHANDYACLLLIDKRYGTTRISSKLPKWIGEDLQIGGFADGVRGVAKFFKDKKSNAAT